MARGWNTLVFFMYIKKLLTKDWFLMYDLIVCSFGGMILGHKEFKCILLIGHLDSIVTYPTRGI